MTTHNIESCATPAGHTAALTTLLTRVRGEFQEMPGMHITLDQGMRLWSMDRTTCTAVLDYLAAAHFLDRDRQGNYMMAHGGY